MKQTLLLFLGITVFISCQQQNQTTISSWELIWSDDFDLDGLPDSTRWAYDVGRHGWGNHELQYYTEARLENVRVEKGRLVIEARRDFWQDHEYTSARLVTRGKAGWQYGRFEIRAKLPSGVGTWPAIWMLPEIWDLGDGKWPDNGEIDIMEHVGHDPGVIHGSTHCKAYYWRMGNQKTGTINVPEAQSAFHTYTLEWNADSICVYVDSTCYFTNVNEHQGWESWPFNKNYYLILNIAIGGDWGAAEGIDESIFPQKMEVEFVRIYKKRPN